MISYPDRFHKAPYKRHPTQRISSGQKSEVLHPSHSYSSTSFSFLTVWLAVLFSWTYEKWKCRTNQACLSIEFSRQEYSSELPFPLPGDLLTQELKSGLLHYGRIPNPLSHLPFILIDFWLSGFILGILLRQGIFDPLLLFVSGHSRFSLPRSFPNS